MSKENEVTLDSWKPSYEAPSLVCSKWRKAQNQNDYHVPPTLSDIPKIKKYIAKNVPDFEIMHSFHMDAKTMSAIHEDRYDAAEGIIAEKPYQVRQKIEKLYDNTSICAHAIVELLSILVPKQKHQEFYRKTKIKKLIKKAVNLAGEIQNSDDDAEK